jgi:hypothetical protein
MLKIGFPVTASGKSSPSHSRISIGVLGLLATAWRTSELNLYLIFEELQLGYPQPRRLIRELLDLDGYSQA